MRVISGLYAILTLLFAAVLYYEMTGFPDGHLTEYDRAMHIPLTIFNWTNIVFCGYFSYISIGSTEKIKQKFTKAFIFHLLLCTLLYCLHYYYKNYLHLESGQGG